MRIIDFLTFDQDGKLIETEITESIVNISLNGDASEINELFINGDAAQTMSLHKKYSGIMPSLEMLYSLCAQFGRNPRYHLGVLKVAEIKKYIYDREGFPSEIERRRPNDIEMMNSLIDAAVGSALADLFVEAEMPMIYTAREMPNSIDYKKLEKLNTPLLVDEITFYQMMYFYSFVTKETSENKLTAKLIMSIRKKQTISSQPHSNCEHASKPFVDFSDPSESYLDLQILRCIKAYIKKTNLNETKKLIEKTITANSIWGNDTEYGIELMERLFDIYLVKSAELEPKKAVLMEKSPNENKIILNNGIIAKLFSEEELNINVGSTLKVLLDEASFNIKNGIISLPIFTVAKIY